MCHKTGLIREQNRYSQPCCIFNWNIMYSKCYNGNFPNVRCRRELFKASRTMARKFSMKILLQPVGARQNNVKRIFPKLTFLYVMLLDWSHLKMRLLKFRGRNICFLTKSWAKIRCEDESLRRNSELTRRDKKSMWKFGNFSRFRTHVWWDVMQFKWDSCQGFDRMWKIYQGKI